MLKKPAQIILFIVLPATIIAAGVIVASFSLGYTLGTKNPEEVIVKGITNIGDPEAKADFSIFWEAWKKLTDYHFDGAKLTPKDAVYGAITGLTNALKDPNTNFFPPDESKKFEEDVNGSFGGIGAEIGIKDDQLIVIAPLKGSPAESAGLKAADKILKVDDKSTEGMSVNNAVKIIRGPIGTTVTLNIFREGHQPKDYKIVRSEIKIPTIDWSLKDNQILHLKLFAFNQNVLPEFRNAIVEASTKAKGLRGLVLDLRNDPGGFLDVAIDLAGWFLKKGDVITIKDSRTEPEAVFSSPSDGFLKSLPTVILINEGSASASEILAGALRVDRGIKLIGVKSFGKGTVQQVFKLRDDSSLKITTAHWLQPNRDSIDKNGIKPDYEVKISEDDIKKQKDPQLDKALEVLNGQLRAVTQESINFVR